MRLEHIQYFVEIANVGSISLAAKNLYISQQGVSNALHQLEQEVGFPLFTRQKRGVELTSNGKRFYAYAEGFLNEYAKMVAFSENTAFQYGNSSKEIFLMTTPLIISFLSTLIYSENQPCRHLPKLRLYEGDLAKIMSSLMNAKVQLGVFFIQKELFVRFRDNISPEIELLELFEDEPCGVVAADSPLALEKSIDYNSAPVLKIAYSSSYQDYFNYFSLAQPDICSNDLLLHTKLIKERQALSLSTCKVFKYIYQDPMIVARPLTNTRRGKYYLARNTNLVNQGAIEWIKFIVENTAVL